MLVAEEHEWKRLREVKPKTEEVEVKLKEMLSDPETMNCTDVKLTREDRLAVVSDQCSQSDAGEDALLVSSR